MKIFEIRKSNYNATIPLKKISEVIENVENDTGIHNVCRKSYTLMLDSGTQTTIDGTTKIIDITWRFEDQDINNNGDWVKIEKEISFEDFYEWYQSQIAEIN